jgi:SAM-dependent methyltransferase
VTAPRVEISLAARNCPICARSDKSTVFAESNVDVAKLDAFAFASRKLPEYMHWRLMECRRCDLLYASPAPDSPALASAYGEAAFDSGLEAGFAARTYAELLPAIRRRIPDLDGALDIGTGDGVFLAQLLGAGFTNVVGVEPSSAPIAAAAPSVRPLIRQAIFRAEDFAPESYSLVTCFQTLEHVPDPLGIVTGIYRILKPGGGILFVVHNRRALSARILGRRSPIFDVEHLQLFSQQSLRRLVTAAGYVDAKVGYLLNRYPLRYWVRLLPFPRRVKGRLIGMLNRTAVGAAVVPLPAGNEYIVAFKPSQAAKPDVRKQPSCRAVKPTRDS